MKHPIWILTLLLIACSDDEPGTGGLNESDQFETCNKRLAACVNGDGQFCLFGYKWGQTPTTRNKGYDALGPQEPGGTVTYSFQESNGLVNTHSQINLPSHSFESQIPCAQNEIRTAFEEWSAIANIHFEELQSNEDADIKIFVVESTQGGIGYPNYQEAPCDQLAGNMIIKRYNNLRDCDLYRAFALHEIGHILGLGHVSTTNIMSPRFSSEDIRSIRFGDSTGIVQLYGAR